MNIYRTEDIQAITDKLDQIVDESEIIRGKLLTPTLDDYKQGMQVIRDFIKKKKRIVYGGDAYDKLVRNAGTDFIYKPICRKDIEFYTPEPIQDLVELCNLLHSKGFPWVQGSQANHDETYKIFVDFDNLCDFTYMPRNVFGNMPVLKIDGIIYSHPSWILVDIFRQYNDPISSYWRLKDKTFFRANILMKNYPLELDTSKKIKNHNMHINFKQQIFDLIKSMDSIIFVGSICRNYYTTLSNNLDYSNMEIISRNFCEDAKMINKHIEQVLGKKHLSIKITMYRPFYQFWDDHVEFHLDGTCLLKIYGNNELCVPYNNLYTKQQKIEKLQVGGHFKPIKGGSNNDIVKMGTFILALNHLLIHRHYQYINRSDDYKVFEHMMKVMLEKRSDYLEKNVLTVMDNSPYKEFVMRCTGDTIDTQRAFRIKMTNKRKERKGTLFRYDPATQKEGFKPPEFIFKNTSGNEYVNGVLKMFSPVEPTSDVES